MIKKTKAQVLKEIEILQEELKKYEEDEKMKLLYDFDGKVDFDNIIPNSFFRINPLIEMLKLLSLGRKLLLVHQGVGGKYIFWMNPQRNRILNENRDDKSKSLPEGEVFSYMIWHAGIWYLLPEKVE